MKMKLDPKLLVLAGAAGAAMVALLGPGGADRRRRLMRLVGRGAGEGETTSSTAGGSGVWTSVEPGTVVRREAVSVDYAWTPAGTEDREAITRATHRALEGDRLAGAGEPVRPMAAVSAEARPFAASASSIDADRPIRRRDAPLALQFPPDRRVGTVYVREDPDRTTLGYSWQELGEARGEVIAPADKDVRLDVEDEASVDLSWLGRLDPDALHTLNLPKDPVTDEQLAHIGKLRGLHDLDLSDTPISDAGLAHLAGLTELEYLNLSNTNVTDAGLAHLRGLTNLRTLHLWGTKISDAGLAHLTGLRNLRELTLAETAVGDGCLAHLQALPKLETLDLSATRVTDAGVARLKALDHLKDLNILSTKVSPAAARDLERAVSDAAVVRERA